LDDPRGGPQYRKYYSGRSKFNAYRDKVEFALESKSVYYKSNWGSHGKILHWSKKHQIQA